MISLSEIIFGLTVLGMTVGVLFLPYAAYVIYYDLDLANSTSRSNVSMSKAQYSNWSHAHLEMSSESLMAQDQPREVRTGRAVSWTSMPVSG